MIGLLTNRYVLGAIAIALIAAAWFGNGKIQYNKGYKAAQLEAMLAVISLEQGMIYERDQADARYRKAILAKQKLEKDLANTNTRISGLLYQLRKAKDTNASSRPNGAGEDWIGLFGACYAEYTDLGGDTARLADKVGGLQDYAKALNK